MLIAIEGIDGSGKGTQAVELVKRLNIEGYTAVLYSFPNYHGTPYGALVGEYLSGALGPMDTIPPKVMAALFAADRSMCESLRIHADDSSVIVVCDRYVPSNQAHQAARLKKASDAQVLKNWIGKLEYETLKMPRPDLVVEFTLPVDLAMEFIQKKAPRDHLKTKADIHESNREYLLSVADEYSKLRAAAGYKKWFAVGVCSRSFDDESTVKPRSVATIHEEVWNHVRNVLPKTARI